MPRLKRILLVNPATEKDRREAGHPPKGSDIFRYPKLGPMVVAGLVPEDVEVLYVDEIVDVIDPDLECDIVGISVLTALAPRAYELAREFRKRGRTVVFGGFHPTLLPDEASLHADAIICGPAEASWPVFLKHWEEGLFSKRESGPLPGKGKIYGRGEASCNRGLLYSPPWPRREGFEYFKRSPSGEKSSGSKSRELREGYARGHVFSVMRGCARRCDFCSIHPFYKGKVLTRSIYDASREMETLPWKIINLVDDNIFSNPSYAKKFFEAMIPFKKHWLFQASLDCVSDRSLMKTLERAGAKGVFVGFESIEQENLIQVMKTHNLRTKYKDAIKRFHEHGMVVEAGMMFGFDRDTKDIFERTNDFFQEAGLDLMQIATVTPMPGTPYFERMKKEGRILTDDLSKFDCRNVVLKPLRMTVSELEEGVKWLRREFYRPDRILLRGLKNFPSLGIVGTFGYYLRGNLGFRKNHLEGLDYPP